MTPARLETLLARRGPPPASPLAHALRRVIVQGATVSEAARAVGLAQPTVFKSLQRLRAYDRAHPEGN